MLSARAPLSVKNEPTTLVSDVGQLSLDKENTVSRQPRPLLWSLSGRAEARRSSRPAGAAALMPFLFALFLPASKSQLQPRLGVQNGAEDLRGASGE